jgi:C4-dicarboxylate transporter, DctM subunit
MPATATPVMPGPSPTILRPGTRRVLDRVAFVNEVLIAALISADILVTFLNTLLRYVWNTSFTWAQDVSTICINLLAFMGAAAQYRRGHGMTLTFVIDRMPLRYRPALQAAGMWFTLGISGLVLWTFPEFARAAANVTLGTLGVSEVWLALGMGLGFLLLAIFAAEKLLGLSFRAAGGGFLVPIVTVLLLLLYTYAYGQGVFVVDPLLAIAVGVAVGFITATPIAFVLALGGLSYIVVAGTPPLVVVPATFQAGIASFILVAIPFFLAAGVLMELTGMASRLVSLIEAWVGNWRGGLLIAQVVAMYVFSGLCGSKFADVATVGAAMKRPLAERGYPKSESVAVLAAAAAMGETIPPSIAMVLLGSITTLSIGTLFLAGFLPALLVALVLIGGILYRSKRLNLPKGESFSWTRGIRLLGPALPALIVPVIVVGGIVGGIGTPTEVSSFAVVYGLVIASIAYHSLDWRTAWIFLRDAAASAGMILLIIATANLLSQAVVIDGMPQTLTTLMESLGGRTLFLVLSSAGLILMGILFEGIPALIVFGPLLLPMAEKFGVNPLQYGIILIIAMGIGVFAPPVGAGLYVACAVGECPVDDALAPSIFYTAVLIFGLLVVIAFPEITLIVPRLFGKG